MLEDLNSKHPKNQKTVLVITPMSEDDPTQSIPVMNAIFASKKMGVKLDCCVFSENDSPQLQQASHLTEGIYIKTTNANEMFHQLLTTFICPPEMRALFPQPIQYSVNCNISCFCHKRSIDRGFVCTSCLSIFCTEQTQCSTCGQANK
eukprot:TRINITY_DN5578_c0_g1_i1.p1 TRINITY_DN5578_c0_g1~~TRINITY_DN5578_c0_g1_i1.p1  ORF type:complete len:148 (+),score=14.03 TRINITY_DN5578_c0_g1_i1:381-824(+)